MERAGLLLLLLSQDQLLVIKVFGGMKMIFIAIWDRGGVVSWQCHSIPGNEDLES